MEPFMDYLVQNPIITVIGAAIIFVLTLIFVIKRIFNFVITLILLVVCLIAGYIVIYPDEATRYFKEVSGREEQQNDEQKSVKDQLNETYESVKEKGKEYFEKLNQPNDSE